MAFYLQCFVFNKPSEIPRHNAFVVDGFKNYKKKVRGGKDCAFINPIGNYHKSFSKVADRTWCQTAYFTNHKNANPKS